VLLQAHNESAFLLHEFGTRFAAIPTTALDPPHSAASPAVPALIGSGSPSDSFRSSLGASDGLNLRDSLKLTEVFVPILR
jgi:hypothetical protein